MRDVTFLGQLHSIASPALVKKAVLATEDLEASFLHHSCHSVHILSLVWWGKKGPSIQDTLQRLYQTKTKLRGYKDLLERPYRGRDEASGAQLTESVATLSIPSKGGVSHWACSVTETSEGSRASAPYWISSTACVTVFSSAPSTNVVWLTATCNFSPRGSYTRFWPPRALRSCTCMHTRTHAHANTLLRAHTHTYTH